MKFEVRGRGRKSKVGNIRSEDRSWKLEMICKRKVGSWRCTMRNKKWKVEGER